MILPLAGYIGKMKFFAGGLTLGNGFFLEIINREKPNSRALIFETKNLGKDVLLYSPGKKASIFLNMISVLLTIVFSLINFLSHFNPQGHIASLIALSALNILIVPAFSFLVFFNATSWAYQMIAMFSDKDSNEWHACEHKSIILIESGLKPTVKNLKKIPMTMMGCGISVYGTEIGVYTAISILVLSHSIIPPSMMPAIMFLLMPLLASYFCFKLNPDLNCETPCNCLLVIFTIPIMAIPLVIERVFALREPSEEKYRETARELKRFIKINQIY